MTIATSISSSHTSLEPTTIIEIYCKSSSCMGSRSAVQCTRVAKIVSFSKLPARNTFASQNLNSCVFSSSGDRSKRTMVAVVLLRHAWYNSVFSMIIFVQELCTLARLSLSCYCYALIPSAFCLLVNCAVHEKGIRYYK